MWQPNKLELERLEKAARLADAGVDLYPARAQRSHRIAEAVSAFTRDEESEQPLEVTLVGRIRRLNTKGQIVIRPYRRRKWTCAAFPARQFAG